MDREKTWKLVWNLIAIACTILFIKAGVTKPLDVTPVLIWFIAGIIAKVMAEYGADWFDIW